MGVFHPDLVGIQARALQRLGASRAMVVYGTDGMDEITLGGETMVAELRDRAASLAIATATEIITSNLDEAAGLKLVDNAAAEIEKLN